MSFDPAVIRDERAFDLPGWREVLARDPDRHVFQTPEWNGLWWEELGAGKELVVLTLSRAGRVSAIVPMYRKTEAGRRVLRFVGGIDLTDYLGPICAPEDRPAVAAAFVEWLAATELEWDELDAHNMPVPLGFAEFLVDHADRAGFVFKLEQEETAAVLPLDRSWDEYLAALGSKERHELRRKLRRLEREHPGALVRTATPDSLASDLATFIDMHRGAEGGKGHFMRPGIATFFTRVAHAFMERGWLRLDLLEIEERAIASTFSFELNGRLSLYNSAYEPDARKLSPGLVLVAQLVRRSIDSGLRVFDFMRGPERYKYQLGAQPVPLHNVRLLNGLDAGPSGP